MKSRRMLTILALVLGLMVWSAAVSNAAPMGTAFTYQGRLIDANSAADGEYDFQFKLFDDSNDPCSGNQLGSDVNKPDVDVIDGYFTVKLDFGSGIFDGNAVWLEIGVRPGDMNDPNTYTVLSPRQQITAAPYVLEVRGIFVDDACNVGIGTTNPTEKVEVAGNVKLSGTGNGVIFPDGTKQTTAVSGGGSVFIRWGNASAPAGTTFLYSGYCYAQHYTHYGGGDPIVVQSGDPGPVAISDGGLLYPLHTNPSTAYIPAGIIAARYVKAAVCYVDAPTVVIWGTHTSPSGWSVVYRGYAMGPYYYHAGPKGLICVDCDNFDASQSSGGTSNAALYGTKVMLGAPGDSNLQDRYVKCAVIKKD
jgi:hypothetical protein